MAKSASRRQQAVQESKRAVGKVINAMGRETPFGDFMREGPGSVNREFHEEQVQLHQNLKAEFEKTGSPAAAEGMVTVGGRNNRRKKRGAVGPKMTVERD